MTFRSGTTKSENVPMQALGASANSNLNRHAP
jgi:hypothetical protein